MKNAASRAAFFMQAVGSELLPVALVGAFFRLWL